MPQYGLERQLEIYSARTPPQLPTAFEDWEARARERLSPGAWGWVAGGAGAEDTMRANREAFYRWRLRPRLPRNVSERDLAVEVLGTPCPAPFMLAPIGVLSIVHPDAELAVARAAAATRIPFILSTVSTTTIEAVAEAMGDAPRWFQLYPTKDHGVTASLLQRAEATGYQAIVITLDTTMLGWRERDLRSAYLPFLDGIGLANYLSDPVLRARLARPPEDDPATAIGHILNVFTNPSFDWQGVALVRERTRLPVLLKGITHPADAAEAVERGLDGVIVSNHGGRQVDGAIAALDALPEVVAAVDGRVPVLMDSGIRRGADVLKALALGAQAVLLGRPYVYGLAVAGEDGVRTVIRNLLAEIELELALCGQTSVRGIGRDLVSRAEAVG